jgi:antitoxin component YwqK of YwqJK toxin-antitoxin module
MLRRTFSLSVLLTLVAAAMASLQAIASYGGGQNQIDEFGKRQGYWVINGFMSNDRSYAPDETVEEGLYRDDRREGVWKKYWPGGKLRSQIQYLGGRPHGVYTLYYENGNTEETGTWVVNKNIGEFRRFHPNGNPQQFFVFNESGKRNGVQKYFHENGLTELEVVLVNGQENGTSKRYDDRGTLVEEKRFEKGIMLPGSLVVHSSQIAKKEVPTIDPYDGEVGKSSKTAVDKPNAAESFKPNGFNTLYNKNGDITQTGEFFKGRLMNGKIFKYNNDGILVRIEIYKNGRFVGTGVIPEADL